MSRKRAEKHEKNVEIPLTPKIGYCGGRESLSQEMDAQLVSTLVF